jgi:hypothetical protein
MENVSYNDDHLGDRYSAMLKSYYEWLHREQKDQVSVATEEVKLRLFLSLLDKPTLYDTDRGIATGAPG